MIKAQKVATKSFEYQALAFSQRKSKDAPSFILFHAPAVDILSWATIDRLEPDNKTGAQRPLRELKVGKVQRYFEGDKRNTIPTAVVVAIDEKAISFSGKHDANKNGEHGVVTITVKGTRKPGLIIDGQHRVFGAKKYLESMHLSVVAFLGDDDSERAFQFVVINNSATRVSKDHIRALNLSYEKDDLNRRLIDSAGLSLGLTDEKYEDFRLVDTREPFKGLLAWPTNASGYVAPNAIEAALGQVRDKAPLLGLEELEMEFFIDVWSRIKQLRPKAWREDSHLLQKVSIYALTVYIVDNLESASRTSAETLDFTKIDTLHTFVDRIVKRIPESFWLAEWIAKELDTSAGRQILIEALKEIDANQRYGRPWYDNVGIVDASELEAEAPAKSGKKSSKNQKTAKKITKKQKARQ
jgi:DGQHR domain-containing protein